MEKDCKRTLKMPIHNQRTPTTLGRSSGLLLHPTSLPGPYGIGDLGPAARQFVDALAKAKQTWWQMLPLTPPGAGDSPYQSHSAFAANPLLISPDDLLADALVGKEDLPKTHKPGSINFARADREATPVGTAPGSPFARAGDRHCNKPSQSFAIRRTLAG